MRMGTFKETMAYLGNNVAKNRMILSDYKGNWECACGQTHYKIHESDVVCQGYWKVLVHCPDDPAYLTVVKLNMGLMGLKFKNYESLAGTKLETQEDLALLRLTKSMIR